MSRSTVAGSPVIIRAGSYDSTAAKEMQQVTCNGSVLILTGTADALPFPGNVELNAAGVDAMTLATPLAGEQPVGDDGKTIFIVDLNGAAHTITTAVNKIINSKHIATFNGTVGSNCMLKAINGVWVPIALAGVTIS